MTIESKDTGCLAAIPTELRALGSAIGITAANDNPAHLPSTNPKRAFGVRKPSAQFIPPVAIIEESAVMALGAAKYGAFNWQDDPVDATTYYSAAIRHLLQWFSGEDRDTESGASHLAHVRACMGILLDAQGAGTLIDDRPNCASAGDAIERLKKAV
ncbi:dATP/dGTP diphosphohydrolase domain-containing protein [Neorhizobium sp. JUb45]|uniref:dATP/dGTP diphosphohydrolase domain-containing protein n=1 Tax=Neorhizobium sp. JUb45 TaxID=2485113 RepID=UPI0010533437|nr:dATP/dGTP diphosphohydrolase domain-containing protein [Neorhizobium sp. JUb45]TCR07303.1 hypothetical protein EDF70_1011276 [Neorhizobium sp. JUb45]